MRKNELEKTVSQVVEPEDLSNYPMLTAYDDSMSPSIIKGDILAYDDASMNDVEDGKVCVIYIGADTPLIKRVYQADDADKYRLVSDSPEYQDLTIDKAKVKRLHRVVGRIRLFE